MIKSNDAFDDFVARGGSPNDPNRLNKFKLSWASTVSANGASSDASQASVAERDGLLGMAQKHMGTIGTSTASVFSTARTSITGAHQRMQENVVSWENLMYFGIASAVGVLFMSIAFLFLPMLLVVPHKFALFFTMGSLSFVVGLVMLRGPTAFLKAVTQSQRLPFTLVYCASVLLTLWASLFLRSYLLALGTAVTQAICLFAVMVSYVPGGRRFLEICGKQGLGSITSCIRSFGGSRGGSSLPL